MMRKTVTVAAALLAVAVSTAGEVKAAEQTYLAARAGVFLPNGKGDGDPQGFKYFDTGYAVDLVAGYRPESYVALEVGTGFYSASGEVSKPGYSIDRTAYGVPITVSVKGLLEFEKIMLAAGAGIGYYQGFISNKISFPGSPVDESNHGGALGYQLLLDAEFKVAPQWSVSGNVKWFTARPEIEMQNVNADGTSIGTTKDEWEIGGTTISLGVKYIF
jgi:hypothetical protein